MKKKRAQTDRIKIEIKMHINDRLFANGAISWAMHSKAKECILKGNRGLVDGSVSNS